MNCEALLANLGFKCRSLSDDVFRVWSPFTFGNDGHTIAVYVQKGPKGYIVSDDAAAAMHASSIGIRLSKKRMRQLRTMMGNRVELSEGGKISVICTEADLSDSISAVVGAAMAVSHAEPMWVPTEADEKFIQKVEAVLIDEIGYEGFKRDYLVRGASGHEIAVPFAIETIGNGPTYIQPVGSRNDSVYWNAVYQGMGRMTDIKEADNRDGSRVVILEEVDDKAEMAMAINILTIAAKVVPFEGMHTWVKRLPVQRRA